MEAKIYRGAEKIVALSPGMRDWIKEVVADKEVYMIPNMADCQFFKKEIKDPKLIEFYHAETPFVVTYLGSIGQTNHLEFLLDIAEKSLQKGLNINFKIVGQGSRLSAIKLQAYLKKLNNVEEEPMRVAVGDGYRHLKSLANEIKEESPETLNSAINLDIPTFLRKHAD